MPSTLLLDQSAWDLVVDAAGNIAVASQPYSLAQDAASAIRTYLGECYWDVAVGVPYLTQIFGKNLPLALLKQIMIDAALTVPGVVSAQVFISSVADRVVSGQVQVVASNGQVTAVPFQAINPQTGGT